MPITPTVLTTGQSTVNATAYVSATYTPSTLANPVYAVVLSHEGNPGSSPTLTGNSLTWVDVDGLTFGTTSLVSVIRGDASSASVTGVTSMVRSSVMTQGAWVFTQWGGATTSTPFALGNSRAGTSVFSLTFGQSKADPRNGFLIAIAAQSSSPITTAGGIQSVASVNVITVADQQSLLVAYTTQDLSSGVTIAQLADGLATTWGAVVVELQSSGTLHDITATIPVAFGMTGSMSTITPLSATIPVEFGMSATPTMQISLRAAIDVAFGFTASDLRPLFTKTGKGHSSGTLRLDVLEWLDETEFRNAVSHYKNTTSPNISMNRNVTTAKNPIDLESLGNAKTVVIIPPATNTAPLRIAPRATHTGLPLSSQGFSVFGIQEGVHDELYLFTTVAGTTIENVRVLIE